MTDAKPPPLEYARPAFKARRNWHEWQFWIIVVILAFCLLATAAILCFKFVREIDRNGL